MDISNIALVRATQAIPFDGIIKPISNTPYLAHNIGVELAFRIGDLLKEKEIIPPFDFTKSFDDEYSEQYDRLSTSILKSYLPYMFDYNSMVLFSLNGLCPDDAEHGFGNNTFSNKTCAVIEPLSKHIDQVISLVPTDTAIKGDVYLSNESIILIEENTYNKLTEQQKHMLNTLDLKIKLFNGPLKEAVSETLKSTNKFIPEDLSLSASTGGIMPSKTSEKLKNLINEIANTYGLSQQKYYNLITSRDKDMPKYEEVNSEYQNMSMVLEYSLTTFLDSLLLVLDAPEYMKKELHNQYNSKGYILKVVELIEKYGLDNYKQFVDNYNKNLEEQQKEGILITSSEIIKNKNIINLR